MMLMSTQPELRQYFACCARPQPAGGGLNASLAVLSVASEEDKMGSSKVKALVSALLATAKKAARGEEHHAAEGQDGHQDAADQGHVGAHDVAGLDDARQQLEAYGEEQRADGRGGELQAEAAAGEAALRGAVVVE